MAEAFNGVTVHLDEDDAAFTLDLHPTRSLLAVGLMAGRIRLYDFEEWQPVQYCSAKPHKAACRALRFSIDGAALFSAGADRLLQQRDVTTNKSVWRQPNAHASALNALSLLEANGIATGDDDGVIKIWDARERSAAMEFAEHSDYISQMLFVPERGPALVAVSGDSRLSVFDLRRGRLEARSDEMEDEVLSVALVKRGKKLVCGMQNGVLGVFSWGDFGDINDRIMGHPEAVDAIAAYDDEVVFTGCSDGLIRAVGVQPNGVLGAVGAHDEPIEAVVLDAQRNTLGSCSHDGTVRLWDVRELHDMQGSDEEQEEVEMRQAVATSFPSRNENREQSTRSSKKLTAVPSRRAAIKLSADFFSDM